jgi:hypothetical protein
MSQQMYASEDGIPAMRWEWAKSYKMNFSCQKNSLEHLIAKNAAKNTALERHETSAAKISARHNISQIKSSSLQNMCKIAQMSWDQCCGSEIVLVPMRIRILMSMQILPQAQHMLENPKIFYTIIDRSLNC